MLLLGGSRVEGRSWLQLGDNGSDPSRGTGSTTPNPTVIVVVQGAGRRYKLAQMQERGELNSIGKGKKSSCNLGVVTRNEVDRVPEQAGHTIRGTRHRRGGAPIVHGWLRLGWIYIDIYIIRER